MKKIIVYSFLFLIVSASCKKQKELPVPLVTDPHFFVKCEMDGQPLDIEAGDQDYYMNSSWFYQDSERVFVYKANLAKQLGTGYQITVLINDDKPAQVNEKMNPDNTLITGTNLFNDQNTTGITQIIKFEPTKEEVSSSSYFWSINDGSKITTYGVPGIENRYSISDIFTVGKTYSVTFNSDNNDGVCDDNLTNVFVAGNKLQATINSVRDASTPDLKYILNYTLLNPNSNIKCLWTFPDATTDETPTPSKFFVPGRHKITLKLTDKVTGDSCTSNYHLTASTSDLVCNANYKATFSPIHNDRFYSSVTILLTTPDGTVFSSKNLVQPNESNFEIISVENYKNNEKNEATRGLGLKFNCVVKNGTSEITLRNGTAKVAVAYK